VLTHNLIMPNINHCSTIPHSIGLLTCPLNTPPSCSQVLDALQHLPHSIKYMSHLQDTQIFRFCAIPQIMAAGTLALCYDNGKVFEGGRQDLTS